MVYKHPIAGKQTTTNLLTKKWLPFLDLFFKSICRRNFLNTMRIHDFSLTAQTLKTFSWSHMEEDFNWVFKVVQNERFHFQEWPKIKIFPHDIIYISFPYNITPESSKEVIKRKENVILGILFDLTPNSLIQNSKKWLEHSIENCYFDLGSERVYWFWITLLCDLFKRSLHFPSK